MKQNAEEETTKRETVIRTMTTTVMEARHQEILRADLLILTDHLRAETTSGRTPIGSHFCMVTPGR